MTRLANPAKEVRRAYADMTRLANPAKEVRRAYADMTRLANPAEEVRRAYADMARLVLCQSLIEGYSFLSLIRASSVVNRQWTVVPC